MHEHTQQLCDALDQLNRPPTWQEASRLGVELVDHDHSTTDSLHLANGDLVYPTDEGWVAIEHARPGRLVRSGETDRVHNPGVNPAARVHTSAHVDPTARVEAGAVIGPRVYISADAHVGRDAHVEIAAFVGSGVFVGPGATVRGGCHLGDGAVVGAGSDLGACIRIDSGTHLAQGTVLDNAGATRHRPAEPTQIGRFHGTNGRLAIQIATTVDRLAALNRN